MAVTCASCGTGGCKLRCKACSDAPTTDMKGTSSTFYCSKTCQTADWAKHIQICHAARDRRSIQRFANIAHEMFLAFKLKTLDQSVRSIVVEGDSMVIHETRREFAAKRFPGGRILADDSLPINDDKTIKSWLCIMACDEAVDLARWALARFFGPPSTHMLCLGSPLGKRIEYGLACCHTANHKLHYKIYTHDGGLLLPVPMHTVIWMKPRHCSHPLIVDLTGLQYDWPDLVQPCEEFRQAKTQLHTLHLGPMISPLQLAQLSARVESANEIVNYTVGRQLIRMIERVHDNMTDVSSELALQPADIVTLASPDFTVAAQTFVDQFREQVERAIKDVDPAWAMMLTRTGIKVEGVNDR